MLHSHMITWIYSLVYNSVQDNSRPKQQHLKLALRTKTHAALITAAQTPLNNSLPVALLRAVVVRWRGSAPCHVKVPLAPPEVPAFRGLPDEGGHSPGKHGSVWTVGQSKDFVILPAQLLVRVRGRTEADQAWSYTGVAMEVGLMVNWDMFLLYETQ